MENNVIIVKDGGNQFNTVVISSVLINANIPCQVLSYGSIVFDNVSDTFKRLVQEMEIRQDKNSKELNKDLNCWWQNPPGKKKKKF